MRPSTKWLSAFAVAFVASVFFSCAATQHFTAGVELGNLGRWDEALKCFDRALEINPRYAEAWSNKGVALGNLGRWDEAMKCYDRALEINPRLAEAWYNKGNALRNLRRYAEARRAFERARELGDPDAVRALENLTREGY